MRRVAVLGVGQTRHAAKRDDVSLPGLLREAAQGALDDAGLGWSDVEAVVLGTAPDMFEGVMQPELYLAGALGAAGKPILRVHTAGSVGGSTGIGATHHVGSGRHGVVLAIAFEKQSESNATWALSPQIPFQPQLLAGAGGYFAPRVRAYIAAGLRAQRRLPLHAGAWLAAAGLALAAAAARRQPPRRKRHAARKP